MFSNKYAGQCVSCAMHVDRGQGIYDYGNVYCGEPVVVHSENVPQWRLRYASAFICTSAIRANYTPTPTREMALTMFAQMPSYFMGAYKTLEVCPSMAKYFDTDAIRAEALAEREEMKSMRAESDAQIRADLIVEIEKLTIESRVRSLPQVIKKVLGESLEIGEMTTMQLSQVSDELHERIVRRESRNNPNCGKCLGTGAYWKVNALGEYMDDGCWSCNGTGKKLAHR